MKWLSSFLSAVAFFAAILTSASVWAGPTVEDLCAHFTGRATVPEAASLNFKELVNAIVNSQSQADEPTFLQDCFVKVSQVSPFLLPDDFVNQAFEEPVIQDDQAKILWTSPKGETREDLMAEYFQLHRGNPSLEFNPQLIVMHWTAGPTVGSSVNTFVPVSMDGGDREILKQNGRANIGCHFIVGQEGDIHQVLPLDFPARHVIGLNHTALCIENVGSDVPIATTKDPKVKEPLPLTVAQVRANVQLIHYLAKTIPTIRAAIGHVEYRALEGTYLFEETNPKYRIGKDDPGFRFLKLVREMMSSQTTLP